MATVPRIVTGNVGAGPTGTNVNGTAGNPNRDFVVENFDTVESLTFTVNGNPVPWTLLPGTRFSATLPTSGCSINLQRGNPVNPCAFQVYIA